MKYDPIEDTKEYKKVIKAVNEEVDKFLKDNFEDVLIGKCHIAWAARKHILKEKYNIDWKTPAEMNPKVCFD